MKRPDNFVLRELKEYTSKLMSETRPVEPEWASMPATRDLVTEGRITFPEEYARWITTDDFRNPWMSRRRLTRPRRIKGSGFYRHGDVALIPIEKVPEHLHKFEGNILEYGESSGHAHQLVEGEFQIYGERECVTVTAPTKLIHEEHNTILLPTGDYEVRRQVEYNPYEQQARAVMD